MENASKALILAGVVFISVLVISIFMYVFSAINDYKSQSQTQLQSTQIIAANRFFVESSYDIDPSKIGVQIYGHDVYNILEKANDINENPDSPNFITNNSSINSGYFIDIDGNLLKANLENKYTYSYGFDDEGYIDEINFEEVM